MASGHELSLPEYLTTATTYHSYASHHQTSENEDSERPNLGTAGTGSSVTEVNESAPLEPARTNNTTHSTHELIFSPINPGNREELTRIASGLTGNGSLQRTLTGIQDEEPQLERKETLAGIKIGDAVLDPRSPEFDAYTWAKMIIRLQNENNVIERRAGFLFKNLKVSGKGSALQLQKVSGKHFQYFDMDFKSANT